jgi:predicted site-specific integrase-resolvase
MSTTQASTLQGDAVLLIDEAADRLRMSVDTLRAWRVAGKGPKARLIANKLIYLDSDLYEWLTGQPTI